MQKSKRNVTLFGKNMNTSVEIAIKYGYIQDKDIKINHFKIFLYYNMLFLSYF